MGFGEFFLRIGGFFQNLIEHSDLLCRGCGSCVEACD